MCSHFQMGEKFDFPHSPADGLSSARLHLVRLAARCCDSPQDYQQRLARVVFWLNNEPSPLDGRFAVFSDIEMLERDDQDAFSAVFTWALENESKASIATELNALRGALAAR
jgi:hypothetical protein